MSSLPAGIWRSDARACARLWPPVVREFVQRAEFEVRAAHGEAAVATAWEEGRTMSLEEAVAYVEGRGGR